MAIRRSTVRGWPPRRATAAGLVVAALTLTTGCGGEPARAEVTGVVTVGGVPCPDLQVTFHPDPAAGTVGRSSFAVTGPDGRYRMLTNTGLDGVMVGTHGVTVVDLLADGGGGGRPARESRTPLVYADARRTPLRGVEVQPGGRAFDIALPGRK